MAGRATHANKPVQAMRENAVGISQRLHHLAEVLKLRGGRGRLRVREMADDEPVFLGVDSEDITLWEAGVRGGDICDVIHVSFFSWFDLGYDWLNPSGEWSAPLPANRCWERKSPSGRVEGLQD